MRNLRDGVNRDVSRILASIYIYAFIATQVYTPALARPI